MKVFQRGNANGSRIKITLNTDNAEYLEAALKEQMVTRVGILGNDTYRLNAEKIMRGKRKGQHKAGIKEVPQTNAEIGLVHEKGSLSMGIERRSFLEMPLVLKSRELFDVKKNLWHAFTGGPQTMNRMREAYKKLGIAAENIIQKAFASGGYGHWKPDSKTTIARKGSSAPLIDTAQLRRSISSDVVTR